MTDGTRQDSPAAGDGAPAAQPVRGAWRFRLVLLAMGTVLGLLAAELVLRVALPDGARSAGEERGYFCRYDTLLGWAPLPDVTARHERDGFSVRVHQNPWGLRGPDDVGPARTSDRERVLVLGDSYAWGYGVDQDLIFTAPGVHPAGLEVLNAGVSGYGTDQAFLLYRGLGDAWDVDRVLLVFTPYNDVTNNLAAQQYGYAKPRFTLEDGALELHPPGPAAESGWGAGERLLKSSRLLNLGASAVRRIDNGLKARRARRVGTEPGRRALTDRALSDEARDGIALTARIVAALRDSVTARGAVFEVAFVPYRPNVEAGLATNHPFVRALAAELRARGIAWLEPYGDFVAARGEAGLFNLADNHFGPRGHEIFAGAVLAGAGRDRVRNLVAGASAPARPGPETRTPSAPSR